MRYLLIAKIKLTILVIVQLIVGATLLNAQQSADENPVPEDQTDSLQNPAIAHYIANRPDEALKAFQHLIESRQERIESTRFSLTETERFRLLEEHPPIDNAFLSFALETNSAQALKSTMQMVIRGKETRVDIFTEEKDQPVPGRFEIQEIVDALPEGSVLWEFVEYNPYDLKKAGSDEDRIGESRYLALTLDRTRKITLKDLGTAAEIDSLVIEARRMIYEARAAVYLAHEKESVLRLAKVTAALYGKIFQPLESSLGQSISIFISPDGQLNLLPFEILTGSKGKYVIETYQISYLSSGRDLLKFNQKPKRPERAVVLASPNYDLSDQALSRRRERLMNQSGAFTVAYTSLRGASDCLETRFSPLRQTHFEATTVAMLLEKRGGLHVDDYQGSDAVEEVLKMMNDPPRVLHLATHGFFCEDQDMSGEGWLENPLLRSGLALSGANRLMDSRGVLIGEGDDGILTAFEVSGLNLVGTEMVVLSACETGMGEVRIGEGVYGLRRAFQHAGAETIVMSLWKVPDKETFRFMDRFYKNWLGGQSKQEALRQSSLNVLTNLRKRYGTAHPLLWGGFILLGNPN